MGMRTGVLAAVVVAVTAVGCSGDEDAGGGRDRSTEPEARPALPALHATRNDRPGVFDEQGRQVVLRGVNLNGLAEYARNNPDLDPTLPITDETWAQIADEGFNVVRLLVSWSRLEPEQGAIDEAYVDEIRGAVRDAAAVGLYVVVDMHQDAWGPAVATPPGVACPEGREPANGWDGAPAWATPAADVSSCRPAEGEAKPGSDLVVEAWHRFYSDADGIQTSLLAVWEHLAEALADETNVAGYDLLNEPGHGREDTAPVGGLLSEFPALGDFYGRAIDAIRQGEVAGGVEPRPIFFEHSVAGNPPPADFSDDEGLVFAPHIYGGSIVEGLPVEANWQAMMALASSWQTSVWAGEYGWWADPADRPEIVERVWTFAQREDGAEAAFVPVGSAWWQWNNGCGDPHQITDAGKPADPEVRQYRVTICPEGDDGGVVPAWREILTRPAVRAAPGRLTQVATDGSILVVNAEAARDGGTLELWVPGDEEPRVGGVGIAGATSDRRGRGWHVEAAVCQDVYTAEVGPDAEPIPASCPEGP